MKKLLCFLLPLLALVNGCKKETQQQDWCAGVVCNNGGVCIDGACVCNAPYTGTDCSQLVIPVQSFVGDYHMVGTTTVYNSGLPPAVTPFDDTLTVSKLNDSTLSFKGFQLQYALAQSDSFYRYALYNPYGSVLLDFHKPFADDSAFYNSNDASPFGGGATIVKLSGKKIQ